VAVSTGERLQAGILAAKQGRTQEAKELLAGVVVIDPNTEMAWFWLGKVLSSPDQSAECFRRVLAINPNNQEAQKALLDLIRPDLSFMPKSTPPGAAPSRPAFSTETEAISSPAPRPSAGDKAETVFLSPDESSAPFTAPPADEVKAPPEEPPSGPASPPYVPPFDESIEEGDEVLSHEDRAALAAEADQRVMGKQAEPAQADGPASQPTPPVETPPVHPESGSPDQSHSQSDLPPAPFPGFIEPEQPPRKASGWVLGICGFLLAVMLLGFPILLLNQDGSVTAAIADLLQPAPTPVAVVIPEAPTQTLVESLPIQVPPAALTPTPVPTQSVNRRLEAVHADSLRGQELIRSGKYSQAVLVWDAVLNVVPEDGDSHYQRGLAYLDLAELPPRTLDEYRGYLKMARLDLDQAIAFGPVKGEYYLARHKALMHLAFLEADSSQRAALLEGALSDAQSANKLGILFEKGLERRPADALMAMGKCSQALEALQTLKPGKTELVDEGGARIDLARAYLCNGQADLAMKQVQAAEAFQPGNRIYWIKALTLYNQGQSADALKALDEWIKNEPFVRSPRYALRALIHYDSGQVDKAGEDLVAAANEGFDVTGLAAYVTARIAVDHGDLATGEVFLAQADTCVPADFGLVARRIHQDYRHVRVQSPPSTPSP